MGLLSHSQVLTHSTPEKGYYISNVAGCPWAYQVRPETVGEYTGLKDENGKEIFEGDILRPSAYKKWKDVRFTCEVSFDNGCFIFRRNGGLIQKFNPLFKSLELGSQAGNAYEVVGNIYENPKMLEGKA